MSKNTIVAVCALLCLASSSFVLAQTLTPTDIGSVGVAGQATRSGDTWTVEGSGADIWGTSDSFQFVQGNGDARGFIIARVDDLQNTNQFAKAGVMFRSGLDPDSPTVILDVKPDSGIEYMSRHDKGGAMTVVGGRPISFPAWLQLSWEGNNFRAFISTDGDSWIWLGDTSISLVAEARVGLAVTSHDNSRLTVAHFSHVHYENVPTGGFVSADVGAVGLPGGAFEQAGEWEVHGAGGDIWATADAFRYVYRVTFGDRQHLVVRVDDLQNTNTFAKAGLMLRSRLDADAATVILDVRPTGDVEFMQRAATGGAMQFVAGAHVTFPAWLQLEWKGASEEGPTFVTASISQDKVHWQSVGDAVPYPLSPFYEAGLAVTSHDTTQLTTAHAAGLSLLDSSQWANDIGATGLTGNAVRILTVSSISTLVEGSGADIWGTSDSFTFVNAINQTLAGTFVSRVNIFGGDPFAKGGLMWRDGLAADAPSVILDLKPDGVVEFMARMCAGCPTTFIAGASPGSSAWLQLKRDGATFTADAWDVRLQQHFSVGSVTVPMATPIPGYAVTSHDTSAIERVLFDFPQD